MQDLPFGLDPQVIFFLVFLLIGLIKNILGKGKNADEEAPPFPTNRGARPPKRPAQQKKTDDPLGDFKRMIEEARREVEAPAQTPNIPKAESPQVRKVSPQTPAPVTFQPTHIEAPPLKPSTFPSNLKPKAKPKPASAVADLSLSALLSSPESARQAIILTEVLGKPKSLR